MNVQQYYRALSRGSVPFVGFADLYPSTWGVSFRKLRGSYTGSCCRVYKVSTAEAQDFGFVNNYVDVAGIEAFLAGSDGYLHRLYDQIGAVNTNYLAQENNSISPKIATAGVVNTNAANQVYVLFNGTDDIMQNTQNNSSTTGTGDQPLSIYSVWNSADVAFSKGLNGSDWAILMRENLNSSESFLTGVVTTSPSLVGYTSLISSAVLNAKKINSLFYKPSTYLFGRRNGVESTPVTPGTNFRSVTAYFQVGRYISDPLINAPCQFMELIKRVGNDGADRSSVEASINSFYNCF